MLCTGMSRWKKSLTPFAVESLKVSRYLYSTITPGSIPGIANDLALTLIFPAFTISRSKMSFGSRTVIVPSGRITLAAMFSIFFPLTNGMSNLLNFS